MNKITGELGFDNAKHLLRRLWSGDLRDIDAFSKLTTAQAFQIIFEDLGFSMSSETEGGREIFASDFWVKKHKGQTPYVLGRQASFLFSMFPAKLSEAHTLDYVAWYGFLDYYALGSFKEAVKNMLLQNNMIRRLPNANENEGDEPNENVGRELLELFTLGKGKQLSKDEYERYTQDDVNAISRILSGYHYNTGLDKHPAGWQIGIGAWGFIEGPKQLSDRFGSVVIDGTQEQQLDQLIEAIFNHPDMGKLVIEKLIRWYANDDEVVNEAVRDHLIQVFKDADWHFEPVLRELFSLEWFYQDENKGSRIMSPMDMFFHVLSYYSASYDPSQWLLDDRDTRLSIMGETWFDPKGGIAGNYADYQPPHFSQYWILSPDQLQARYDFFSEMVLENGPAILMPFVDGLSFDEAATKLAKYVFAGELIEDELIPLKAEALGNASVSHWDTEKEVILTRLLEKFYRSPQAQLH